MPPCKKYFPSCPQTLFLDCKFFVISHAERACKISLTSSLAAFVVLSFTKRSISVPFGRQLVAFGHHKHEDDRFSGIDNHLSPPHPVCSCAERFGACSSLQQPTCRHWNHFALKLSVNSYYFRNIASGIILHLQRVFSHHLSFIAAFFGLHRRYNGTISLQSKELFWSQSCLYTHILLGLLHFALVDRTGSGSRKCLFHRKFPFSIFQRTWYRFLADYYTVSVYLLCFKLKGSNIVWYRAMKTLSTPASVAQYLYCKQSHISSDSLFHFARLHLTAEMLMPTTPIPYHSY